MQNTPKHAIFGYRISQVTGKRLPSVNVIHSKLNELERRAAELRAQLAEHTQPTRSVK